MARRPNRWAERAGAVRDRLDENPNWFPIPAFIAFGLVIVLTGHILFGTNPRAGNPANIISFPSEPRADAAIWLSVTPIDDQIVVTTSDRKVFKWRQQVRTPVELSAFTNYLKRRVADEVEAAAMAKRALKKQATAVIAADQRLKYLHIRPIIYALAEAGISQYAFETQNPVVAAADPHHADAEEHHPE
jgi:biopolymer transport protein ExbD